MADFVSRAAQVLSPVLGRYFNLNIQSGSGCYLTDTAGRQYLDFASGIAVASTGHCHPQVVSAVHAQVDKLIHPCIAVGVSEPVVEMAEKLIAALNSELTSVFFCQSGTEAIEAAIKLARFATKKSELLAFTGGFHGRTLGALSVTSSKLKYQADVGPLLPGVSFFPFPYCYRCPWSKDPADCQMVCIGEMIAHLDTVSDRLAAVIIEPVLGEGGYIPAPDPFLDTLITECQRRGILVIMDEIQTGAGRSGHWAHFNRLTATPDIAVFAKGIASGFPLGAMVAKADISAKWTVGSHGSTYGSNPVSCAAGAATIDVLTPIIPTLPAKSARIQSILTAKLHDHPNVGDIRVMGLMAGIELVTDRTTRAPHPTLVREILADCLERGVIVLSCGIYDQCIRIIPPLIVSDSEIESGLETIASVICAHR